MVKVLVVSDGNEGVSAIERLLSGSLQVEIFYADSLSEGLGHFLNIRPDIILIPQKFTSGPDISKIVGWQSLCKTEGLNTGFLLFSFVSDTLFFLDISQGSSAISGAESDTAHQIISVFRQLSGRSKVERSLREDYDLHNRTINAMPISFIGVENGYIHTCNPAFLRLSGYDEPEILGKSRNAFIDPDQAEDLGFILCDECHQEKLECVLRSKTGENIPCRLHYVPVKLDRIGDGLWFIEDGREYTALRSTLKETEYECREQLYLSETLVMKLRPDGIISFSNPAASRCFGYENNALVGNSVSILFPSGIVQETISPVELFLDVSDESSSAIHIFEHCKKNGNPLWIAWTSRSLYSSQNELSGIICVGTDMTEQSVDGTERVSTRVWRDRILASTDISPEVFDAVLQACMEIGREGREGKALGTSFLVGDSEAVMIRSRQLILNPFSGHPPEMRNVSLPDVREMLKEYALLDGAFVVSGDGLLEAAGRYITLDTSSISLPKGLGTRHSSVAALTGVTNTIGFVVSESGGKVSIMKKGKIVKVIA